MAETNLEFLGNDKQRLGEVSGLFSNREDLDAFLKIVEESAAMEGSTQQKREHMLKNMLGTPKFRQYLKVAMPALYKEGLKAERGEGWKMSMKDIAKAANTTEEKLLDPKTGWMGSEVPMADLRFLMESEGLDYKDAVKLLQEAQTVKNRKDLWDNEDTFSKFAMSAVAPFASGKLSKGEVPSDKDLKADAAMFGVNLLPWGSIGRAAGLVSIAGRGIPGWGLRGIRYGAEFAGPGMTEGALSLYTGDSKNKLDALLRGLSATGGNAATGATLAGGSSFLKSWASKDAKEAMKTIEDAIKEAVYPEEIKTKLRTIKTGLDKHPETITAADLEFLRNIEAFQKLKKGGKFKLGDIGKYSPEKYNAYMTEVNKNPAVKASRDAKKATLDEYEQKSFERNPGILTFTDVIEGNKNLDKIGFGKKAGLGPIKKGGIIQEHHLINSEGRSPLTDWVTERNNQIKFKDKDNNVLHTDYLYPGPDRSATDLDKYVEGFINANPEVKMYIDNGLLSKASIYTALRDALRKRLYPQVYQHGKSGLASRKDLDQENSDKEE